MISGSAARRFRDNLAASVHRHSSSLMRIVDGGELDILMDAASGGRPDARGSGVKY